MILINKRQAKVCLDPGHGGHDPGAIGPKGTHEAKVALLIAKELMYQLDCEGIDSVLTRTDDETSLALSQRVEASKGFDCFLSIHCNSAENRAAEGIETIYSDKAGPHKALANYIQQAMMKIQGHKDRKMRMSPSMDYPRKLYILSMAVVPAALVECEFLSNEKREEWLASDEGQKQVAYALCQGIKSFLLSLPGAESKMTEAKPAAKEEPGAQTTPVTGTAANPSFPKAQAVESIVDQKVSKPSSDSSSGLPRLSKKNKRKSSSLRQLSP